jgi:DNA-directed RNA polymerase specialized sigma24 family protein
MEWDGFHERFLRARAGDRPTLDWLIALVRKRVACWVGHAHGTGWDSSDVVQEIVLVVLRKLPQCEGGDDDEVCWKAFWAWVCRIVGTRSITVWKRMLRLAGNGRVVPLARAGSESSSSADLAVAAPDPSPSEQASLSELVLRLAGELKRLDAHDRRIVEVVMNGGSLRQLAAELDRDASTLQKHFKHKILPRLRRALGDQSHVSPDT